MSSFAQWRCIFGVAHWKCGQTHPTRQTPAAAKYAFVFWLVLLIPWLLFALCRAWPLRRAPTAGAYTFVWSVWTYPGNRGSVQKVGAMVSITSTVERSWVRRRRPAAQVICGRFRNQAYSV